jgi:hypothetical protein
VDLDVRGRGGRLKDRLSQGSCLSDPGGYTAVLPIRLTGVGVLSSASGPGVYEDTFIADGLLDRLPTPAQIGATRVGGVDLNKPPTCHSGSRLRGPHPGRAVRGPGAVRRVGLLHRRRVHRQVHAITGHTGYTVWQAAYLLRKLRGNELITKPGRTRRYHLQPRTAGSIAALLTLREHVSHRSSPASAALA